MLDPPTPPSGRLSKKPSGEAGGDQGDFSGGSEVELFWAEDEARLGLKPVVRRASWAPVGKRPVARFKRGYKWTSYDVYGFVGPESGEVYWLILPTLNVQLFSMALFEFAKERWEPQRTSESCWWWRRLGGTQAERSNSPKGYTPTLGLA